MASCYYCAAPNTAFLDEGSDTFPHALARSPRSTVVQDQGKKTVALYHTCPLCHALMHGELVLAWEAKEGGDYSQKWTRNYSWLLRDRHNLMHSENRPYFGDYFEPPAGKKAMGKGRYREILNPPRREDIRAWLIDPPAPPFTIAIAQSQKKHIFYLAVEAQSRDYFPVTFELDLLHIDRVEFSRLLENYELLWGLGFHKAEINEGNYSPQRLTRCLDTYLPLETAIAPYRGSRLFDLAAFVAQKQNPLLDSQ